MVIQTHYKSYKSVNGLKKITEERFVGTKVMFKTTTK